jgi:hypothetical protein
MEYTEVIHHTGTVTRRPLSRSGGRWALHFADHLRAQGTLMVGR